MRCVCTSLIKRLRTMRCVCTSVGMDFAPSEPHRPTAQHQPTRPQSNCLPATPACPGPPLGPAPPAGHQRWVWDCVFSVDAAYLVTASSDCTARLW